MVKKRIERSDAYLTHVCRLPLNIESLQRIDKKKPELSANTIAEEISVEID